MSRRWVPRLAGWLALTAAIVAGLFALAACLTERANLPPPRVAGPEPPPPGLELSAPRAQACREGPIEAALANGRSLHTLAWAPFRRQETGWAIYEPMIANEIRTPCAADTQRFAAALRDWQRGNGLPATGVLDEASFLVMKRAWQGRRPLTRTRGVCPDPPPDHALETARPEEGYRGTVVRLRPQALSAWRRLVADAREEVPEVARDPELLTIFSSFRSPAYDAARCARDQNCDGVTRAACSPHRTGFALDVYLGSAPGYPPDSSADPNRLYMARSAAYRWLVAHAPAYGFANYPFEPWHWEYVGGPRGPDS